MASSDQKRVILCTRNAAKQIEEVLRHSIGDGLDVIENPSEIPAAIERADALFCPDFFYNAEVAHAVKRDDARLSWIQLLTAGCDNVLRHGVPARVTVTNAGGAFADSVALHAVTLLLALCRQIPVTFENQRMHGWERGFMPRLSTPESMTIAILGLGHIGQTIAALLSPWKPHIVGISRTARQCAHVAESLSLAELPEVLGRSDAVFVALSLNAETDGLFDSRLLSRCKSGCLVVNISRGSIIDHQALADALVAGAIGGAGLDVTHPEPLPPSHPLWSAPNLIVTPHIAGSSGAMSSRRLAEMAADNLQRFLAGQPLANVVS